MPRLFGDTVLRALDANGEPVSGARCYVYTAGTTTPVTTYSDAALTTPQAHPVVADSSGVFAPIFVAAGSYKASLTTSADAALPGYPVDNLVPPESDGNVIVTATGSTQSQTLAARLGEVPTPGGFAATDRGFWSDDGTPVAIGRLTDRVFVGTGATGHTGNRVGSNGYGTSWLTDAVSWPIKNATFVAADDSTGGQIGVLGASRTASGATSLLNIGVMGLSYNAGNASVGRAGYFDVLHESAGGTAYGVEIQMRNGTTDDPVANAYTMTNSRANALYIGAESGHAYTAGDSDTALATPTKPCGAAIDISGGSIGAAYQKFVVGVVFRNGSLLRDGSTNRASAVSMAQDHEVRWEIDSSNTGAKIWSDVTVAAQPVGLQFTNRRVRPVGGSERVIADFVDDPTASGDVNWLEIRNSSTGASPSVQAAGDSANLDITLTPKGTGAVRFGTATATGDLAATHTIRIKAADGTLFDLLVRAV